MRLIDADEIPYITTYREDWLNNTTTEDQCAWKSNIDAMPTIEERKTGRWVTYKVSPWGHEDIKCSECGKRGCSSYWNFCPACGADMRGEDDGGRES